MSAKPNDETLKPSERIEQIAQERGFGRYDAMCAYLDEQHAAGQGEQAACGKLWHTADLRAHACELTPGHAGYCNHAPVSRVEGAAEAKPECHHHRLTKDCHECHPVASPKKTDWERLQSGEPWNLPRVACEETLHAGHRAPAVEPNCGNCWTCLELLPKVEGAVFDSRFCRMVLCVTCGNKRCPKANNHRNECSNSNEPGQPGSAYEAAPVAEPPSPVAARQEECPHGIGLCTATCPSKKVAPSPVAVEPGKNLPLSKPPSIGQNAEASHEADDATTAAARDVVAVDLLRMVVDSSMLQYGDDRGTLMAAVERLGRVVVERDAYRSEASDKRTISVDRSQLLGQVRALNPLVRSLMGSAQVATLEDVEAFLVGGAPSPVTGECSCFQCEELRFAPGTVKRAMIVCPECGNKRCPKAYFHGYVCTNSNDLNQQRREEPSGKSWWMSSAQKLRLERDALKSQLTTAQSALEQANARVKEVEKQVAGYDATLKGANDTNEDWERMYDVQVSALTEANTRISTLTGEKDMLIAACAEANDRIARHEEICSSNLDNEDPATELDRLNPFKRQWLKQEVPAEPLASFLHGIRYYAGMLEDDDNWSHGLGHIEELCVEFDKSIHERAGKPYLPRHERLRADLQSWFDAAQTEKKRADEANARAERLEVELKRWQGSGVTGNSQAVSSAQSPKRAGEPVDLGCAHCGANPGQQCDDVRAPHIRNKGGSREASSVVVGDGAGSAAGGSAGRRDGQLSDPLSGEPVEQQRAIPGTMWFYAESSDAESWQGPHYSLADALEAARSDYTGSLDSFWVDEAHPVDWGKALRRFVDADDMLERFGEYAGDNERIEDPEPEFKTSKVAAQDALEVWAVTHLSMRDYWQCIGKAQVYPTDPPATSEPVTGEPHE